MGIFTVTLNIMDPLKDVFAPMFSFIWKEVKSFIYLGGNVETLDKEMKDLNDMKRDVERCILIQEVQYRAERTNQVRSWMENVDSLQQGVDSVLESFKNKVPCLRGCSCWQNCQTSRRAAKNLEQVRELKSQGNFIDIVSLVPPPPVEERPGSSVLIIGGEESLSKIWGYIKDDRVGIIGIFGMGGVGKTTLLSQINSSFLSCGNFGFDTVIWATVSRDLNILKIQKDIGERLGLSFSQDRSPSSHQVHECAKVLHKALSRKRFLLLLDDVWEKLEFGSVGIPLPNSQNRCKVAFTTRSALVCDDMDADARVPVGVLDKKMSWELFARKLYADPSLNDLSIRQYAEKIMAKCGGLPLALITVGRAMASKKTLPEWRDAMRALENCPGELRGMEDVFSVLKFSYDSLENDVMRSCLLYCSLFPEDELIYKKKLVECWIGEHLLDIDCEGHSMDCLRDRGHAIIGSLQAACLLEISPRDDISIPALGIEDGEGHVKMHDVIREMALWLTNRSGQINNFFLCTKPLLNDPTVEKWALAKRISLMCTDIKELPAGIPQCTNLLALLIDNETLKSPIPCAFFTFMPVLRVLDLTRTEIDGLPMSIGSLITLQYLNLSHTGIRSLPKQLGMLVKLRLLDLRGTVALERIPYEAISPLSKLESLDLLMSAYQWRMEKNGADGSSSSSNKDGEKEKQASLIDLEGLDLLNDLKLQISSLKQLNMIINSYRLSKSLRLLLLKDASGLTTSYLHLVLEKLESLRGLYVVGCRQLEGLLQFNNSRHYPRLEFLQLYVLPLSKLVCSDAKGGPEMPRNGSYCFLQNLRHLDIRYCHGLRELAFLQHLPLLQKLILCFCKGIKDLLPDVEGKESEGEGNNSSDMDTHSFLNLKQIVLYKLPALRSIARRPLHLPSLEKLHVEGCPLVKMLPLDPGITYQLRKVLVLGEQQWWDGLDWDQTDFRPAFIPYAAPDFITMCETGEVFHASEELLLQVTKSHHVIIVSDDE